MDNQNARYLQFQQVQEQLQHFNAFLEELLGKKQNILGIIKALEDMSKTKPGQKMLVPLSNGIFVESSIQNTAEVIVNVGSDVCVKKPISETIKLLRKRGADVQKNIAEIEEAIEQLRGMELQLSEELQQHV